jgi:hypothetical protein
MASLYPKQSFVRDGPPQGNGTQILMNDYEDVEYFTTAFPTLFPYGRGGHMPASDERSIPVSLEA